MMGSTMARMRMEAAVEDAMEILWERAYSMYSPLQCTAYVTREPLRFADRKQGEKMQLSVGDKWAQETFDCAWFHITGEVPTGIDMESMVFLLNCGGEGLVYTRDGIEKQSITCTASQYDYQLGKPVKRVVFPDGLVFNDRIDFWVDCAANDLFGNLKEEARVAELHVAQMQPEIRALAYDLQVLYGAYEQNTDEDFQQELLQTLHETGKQVDEDIDDATAAQLRKRLAPLWAQHNSDTHTLQYMAVGHGHLDLAWLWPLRESKRKAARTLITQLMHLERYPDYVFGASQAQLYQWMKDGYPRIYDKVLAAAKTPRWEVQGATWVEMDSNLIAGESMIRQFFYGKQFFRQEFNQEMEMLWLPDSFGYSACLPQVMQLSDVPYFLTQKLSWNTVNKFPHHSFYWKGLDGTAVLSHMLPEDTYNSPMNPEFLRKGEENYTERAISDRAMILFGIGDGGAGPGFEHLERLARLKDVRGIPKVTPGSGIDFFRILDDGKTPYPSYQGELYLEKHQGTYTTQVKNKWFNRKCEFALNNYAWLMAAAIDAGCALPIKKAELDDIWKEVLLYQFHDILPGSSINRVYTESVARYTVLYARLQEGVAQLLAQLAGGRALVNFTPFSTPYIHKIDGNWKRFQLPAMGYAAIDAGETLSTFFAKAGEDFLENDRVRVTFSDGVIVSLWDKQLQREFCRGGAAMAQISQYEDTGDGWDIAPVDYYKNEKVTAICTGFSTGTDGAQAYAEASYTVGDCRVQQRFSILDGSAQVDCTLDLDVNQASAMLRIAFPTAIETEECNFNLPFGHLTRRTTENNSIETAQYEVSGQKFVDLSEESYGLSLLNDCKYGFRCKDGLVDMNLVRSPKEGPSHDVDQGKQRVVYALLPHTGALGMETYRAAYLLNNPPQEVSGRADATMLAQYCTSNEQIVLESVKVPEDGNGLMARFYNAGASAASAQVELAGYRMQAVANVMEETREEKTDGCVTLNGFALVNIRFVKA